MSIELVSRRGPIGKGWQAVALRDGAERLLGSSRVGRGKADARAGRVQWLDVDAGTARGDVLDADGELYQARLDLPAFREDDRRAFLEVAHRHPELAARMAGGVYPQQIEAELARSEISLLPRDASELSHDCSCLDWPGPCRHVAALVYVLVEAVDATPGLLLTLRGLTLGDLVPPERVARPGGRKGPAGMGTDADPAAGPGEPEDGAEPGVLVGEVVGLEPERPDPPAPYDPSRLDPATLVEALGPDAAALIHGFYTRTSYSGKHA